MMVGMYEGRVGIHKGGVGIYEGGDVWMKIVMYI